MTTSPHWNPAGVFSPGRLHCSEVSMSLPTATLTIRRVPLEDLRALCSYFDCDVGDILRAEEVPAAAMAGHAR